jgi:3-oxoacyl-[acyl-carrier protein] reductase
MRLAGKVAIITGGGSGIGRAAAIRFASEGARLVVADLDAAAEEVAGAIQAAGGEAAFQRCDVSRAADAETLVTAAVARFGGIDVLYNNAAIQLHGHDVRAHELAEEIWDRTMATNLKGVWLCSKYAIPVMIARGGGTIIHAASPTGLRAAPPYTAYSASKGGVIALMRTMAAEYARDNIRVNAIVPGPIETPLTSAIFADSETRARLLAATPLGRLGTPDDVVGLLVFLASDEARFCTGGLYMADGGQTAA